MCKISIITPVYNVGEYLEKNLESICQQTFTDFELIIVNDGSTDNSREIAESYQKKDDRIIVINKENGGAPSARNAGIDISKGKYLYFPDSDDWLDLNYLKDLYDLAEKTSAEITISGFTMEYYENGRESSYEVSCEEHFYNNKDKVRHNIHKYLDNMMVAVPWNKLYLSSYIKREKLYFPNLKWDDLHFNLECLKNASKVAISPCSGYHFFRSRPGSETTIVFDDHLYSKRKEQFEHILEVYNDWGIKDSEILESLYGYYLGRLVQCVLEISINNKKSEDKKESLNILLNDSLTKDAFEKGKVNSTYLRILSNIMKTKSINLNMLMGKNIGFIKNNLSSVFYYLKSNSVNKAKIK